MYSQTLNSKGEAHPFKRVADQGESGPLHPGEILREDFLPYHRIGPKELASRMQVPLETVIAILDEQHALSPDLAERLSAVFALPPRYWLALQRQFDLWHTPAGALE